MQDIKSEPPREGRLNSSVAAEESTSGGYILGRLDSQFKPDVWLDFVARDVDELHARFRSLIDAELRREAALVAD